MEQYQWLTTLPSLLIIALLGMLMHFFKQKIKGEHLNEIIGFFKDNAKSTIVAVVSTLIASVATYFTMATGQPIDLMTFFGIGYMCDSVFNKWDNKPGVQP